MAMHKKNGKPMNGGKSKDCNIMAFDLSDNLYENI